MDKATIKTKSHKHSKYLKDVLNGYRTALFTTWEQQNCLGECRTCSGIGVVFHTRKSSTKTIIDGHVLCKCIKNEEKKSTKGLSWRL